MLPVSECLLPVKRRLLIGTLSEVLINDGGGSVFNYRCSKMGNAEFIAVQLPSVLHALRKCGHCIGCFSIDSSSYIVGSCHTCLQDLMVLIGQFESQNHGSNQVGCIFWRNQNSGRSLVRICNLVYIKLTLFSSNVYLDAFMQRITVKNIILKSAHIKRCGLLFPTSMSTGAMSNSNQTTQSPWRRALLQPLLHESVVT